MDEFPYDPYDNEDEEVEEFNVTFEILNSEDNRTVTLVCAADQEITPDDFAELLRGLADRIETLVSLNEFTSSSIN